MRGRYDHPLYVNGAEDLLNVIPTPGGSLIRRPGTKKITDTLAKTSRMITFQDQENNGALLIFAPGSSLKVYQGDTLVKTITHNIEDGAVTLQEMDYCQVRDFMFFVHRSFAPKMFVKSRTQEHTGDGSTTAFSFDYVVPDTANIIVKKNDVTQTLTTHYTITTYDQVDGLYQGVRINFVSAPANNDEILIIRDWGWHTYPNQDGPWEDENTDATLKITLERNGSTSGAADEGWYGSIQVNAVNKKGATKTWANDNWVGRSMRVYGSDGTDELYANVTLDSVATTKQEFNGTISSIYRSNETVAAGAGPFASKTKRWALSAWYTGQYPEVIGVHQDSLWFGRDDWRWKTVAGSLFRFSPSLPDQEQIYQVSADSGITVQAADPVASKPVWLHSDKVLFSATDVCQMMIQGSSAFGAIAPSTVSIMKQNDVGAAKVKPVSMNQTYFVDNLRQNIYAMKYQFQTNAYVAEKANNFDDQLFYKRIRRMALITQPFAMLWCVMDDGTIINITNNDIDNNFAPSTLEWQTGNILDVSVLRQSDGSEKIYLLDQNGVLYKLGTFGTFAGVTRDQINFRTTQYLSTGYFHTYSNVTEEELLTDAATVYAADTTIDLNSDLTASQIAVDSTTYENYQYSAVSREITPENIFEVGTPFDIRVKTNYVNTTQGTLTDLGRKRKLTKVKFNLTKTLNFKVKHSDRTDFEEVKMAKIGDDLSEPPAVFTGLKNLDIKGDRSNVLQLTIEQNESVPFTLNSIIYEYDI